MDRGHVVEHLGGRGHVGVLVLIGKDRPLELKSVNLEALHESLPLEGDHADTLEHDLRRGGVDGGLVGKYAVRQGEEWKVVSHVGRQYDAFMSLRSTLRSS